MMQRYRSHKEVSAARIAHILCGREDGAGPGATLLFEDGSSLSVSEGYMGKHDPAVGGYYVRYEDGYESFSPAKAFEDGYTIIG